MIKTWKYDINYDNMQTHTEIKQNFVEKTEYVNRASPK